MSQTKKEIEQELKAFKDANPNWMADAVQMTVVASYNNRLASTGNIFIHLHFISFVKNHNSLCLLFSFV